MNVYDHAPRRMLAACVLLALAACQPAPQPAPPQTPPEVGVVTLKTSAQAMMTELSGRTSAYLVADVRPQVSGIIRQRNFVEGGQVKAGQALYQIDPASYQAAQARAEAALAKAKAGLASTRVKAERLSELARIKAASQQDADDANAAYLTAQSEVLSAQAALKTAQIDLAYTRVAAPISGRVGKSSVTPGALVTANQAAALATIQQLDPIYVDVTQSSAQLLQLKRELASGTLASDAKGHARVRLKLEDGSDYPLDGQLAFSDVTVAPDTGTVTLRALFPNPDGMLLPGMYVRATVQQGVNPSAILVPQRGVSRNAKGEPTVLLVDRDGKVASRVITTSRTLGDAWLVEGGLKAGERVVVEGLQKVRPGAKVKAVEVKAAPAAHPAPAAH